MKITQLYIYPIKSIRAVSLTSTQLSQEGFQYDRRFMLVRSFSNGDSKPRTKVLFNPDTGLENMTITFYPELGLFKQSIDIAEGKILVEHSSPSQSRRTLEISLEPDPDYLESIQISLHRSCTKAYVMDDQINKWFSDRLDMNVMLVYLGSHRRDILGNLAPNPKNSKLQPQSWMSSLSSMIPYLGGSQEPKNPTLGFTDLAALLVLTEESLQDVSSRFATADEVDVTKFRPNIVLSGSAEAYEEDYWGGLQVYPRKSHDDIEDEIVRVVLTQNCGRCQSLNVDYNTGQFGKGEVGTMLKKLMKDRRVDPGNKYSPVFGRYGFLEPSSRQENHIISVGDEVQVSKRIEERTTFCRFTKVSSS